MNRYLHALVVLTAPGRRADTGHVAARVGVSDAAASRMLKNLAAKRLVRLEPYQGAELTPAGMLLALRVVRRHRLIEVFLHRIMRFDLGEIHDRALKMEPTVDQAFEDRLDEILGRPEIDPHGQPIPTRDAGWPRLSDAVLLELPVGSSGRVSRVASEDADAISYLDRRGVQPGAQLTLETMEPFDGPVTVRIGERQLHLGRRLAQLIHVRAGRRRRGHDRRASRPAQSRRRNVR